MKLLFSLLLFYTLVSANERIIALSPAIGEILYGLGLYEDVIAVSSYSTYPKEVKDKPKIGGYFSPDLEKIITLKPSLVIGSTHNAKLLKKLEHFHIKTLKLQYATLNDIENSITNIAKATNTTAKGKILLDSIHKAYKQTPSKTPNKRVLVVFGAKDSLAKSNYVAGHDSFYEEILHICGVQNAYNHNYLAQPVLDYESLIRLNPDEVIILYSPQTDSITKKALKAQWKKLPINAAKEDAIHILEKDYLFIGSQRVALSIHDICEIVR